MMALLLVYSSLFILSLQTSLANPHCTPSSCGIIRNLSYPFRLRNDPSHCGDPAAELVCENNVTSLYLNSHKYYVQEINYNTTTSIIIRLVDASININDPCSFPIYSVQPYTITSSSGFGNPYLSPASFTSINVISCPHPHPLKNSNSSVFTDITHMHCQTFDSSNPRFTYIRVGSMKVSDVTETCRVELIVMTSWEFKDVNNVSLQEIHQSLLYGFDLDFCRSCFRSLTAWEKLMMFFYRRLRSPFLILLVIVVLSGGSLSPVMSIIGVTIALGFLLSFSYVLYHAIRDRNPLIAILTFTDVFKGTGTDGSNRGTAPAVPVPNRGTAFGGSKPNRTGSEEGAVPVPKFGTAEPPVQTGGSTVKDG